MAWLGLNVGASTVACTYTVWYKGDSGDFHPRSDSMNARFTDMQFVPGRHRCINTCHCALNDEAGHVHAYGEIRLQQPERLRFRGGV